MKHIKEFTKFVIENLNKDKTYAVVLTGGSIGDKPRPRDARGYVGNDASTEELFTNKEAKEKAKRMNKILTPGEKKHYGLKYVVVPVKNNKFIKESNSLYEASTSWSVMMKGINKSETGPWSIIATNRKKVIAQKIGIIIPDSIPAHYEAMAKEFPDAKIHIEDATGKIVWRKK